MVERRRGGLEAHEELIFIHRLVLVGSNDHGISRRHKEQIEYSIELILHIFGVLGFWGFGVRVNFTYNGMGLFSRV